MLNPIGQYELGFTSDGIATALVFDCSLVPLSIDFAGNIPSAVMLPVITTNNAGVTIPTYTAALNGTSVTVTFQSAPPQLDVNGKLVIYNLSFVLQFPD